jgi:hypothetical protein
MSKERTGDKENGTSDSVRAQLGLTALYHYVTVTYYHVIAIYRYLPFSVILYQHLHLRPVGRPYGLSYGP